MAQGNNIVVTGEPRGRFLECTVSGTPKPGTAMLPVAATAAVSGRFTWAVYTPGTDGEQRMVAVLLSDRLQGKLATDAYVTGTRGFLYIPLPGDELNMLKGDVAGTADDFAIADPLMLDTGTGKVIATTGSPESEAFMCMETVTDPTADVLVFCMFTGY